MYFKHTGLQLSQHNQHYVLPWLPSFTSGFHGGRQMGICSHILTLRLFSRAREKPQQ